MNKKQLLFAALMLVSVLGFSQVPTNGLLKEYRFAGGSLSNTSAYPDPLPIGTIDLTPTGSAMTTVADRGGIAGQAVSLNGDYFTAGGGPIVTTDERENMTASFWIKTNTQDANYRFILHHFSGSQGWYAAINNGNIVLGGRFLFWRVSPAGWTGSSTHTATSSGVNVADNQWHHVVVQTQATSSTTGGGSTYSRLDLTIWVDNVIVGSHSGIDYTLSAGVQRCNPGDLTEMLVGTSSTSPQLTGQYLDELDDIRIYRTALSLSQIDSLYNEQVNPCATPSAVSISNPTATTVDIDWTNGGSETSWEVEAVVSGGAQGSGTVQTAGSHPYTFTGLDSNTDYDFYVKADCGGGSTSGWTSPETETTLCGIQTCEFEDFSDAVFPSCWTAVASNGGAVSGVNISNNLKLRFGPNYNSTFTAALPEMASINGYLSFKASNSTTTATPYSFVVGTMSDPSNQATFTPYQTTTFSGNNGSTTFEVDLTGYTGTDKFIAFRYVYGANINVHVYVDDVVFTDGTCYWNKVFVDSAATGNNDGTSWADAYTDLQDALFNYNGDAIWVAKGTYFPGLTREATFSIPSGAKVYGGFDKTESWLSQRDLENNISRLSGDIFQDDNGTLLHTEATRQDNSFHVITFKGNVQGALVNGFAISDGNANGVANNACSTPAASQSYNLRGGAVYANPYATGHALSADVTQCVLENNTATSVAVYSAFTPCGVQNLSYNVDFDRCIVRNNYSHVLTNMLISGSSGYGIIANSSVTNSLFYGNKANAYATCLFISASTSNGGNASGVGGQIINNTFADNTGFNAAIYYSNGNNTGLKNNIIWNNGDTTPINGSGGPTADHNLVEGGYGTNTVNSDPLFVDAPNGDYRLMANSPAYNTGGNSYGVGLYDLDGEARYVDGTIDMGAYEYFVPPCLASAPVITGFSNLSHHGTTISWNPTDVPVGGKFVVRYHEFGNSPNFTWKNVPNENATSAYINGLDASTRYVFRVGGKCPTGNAVYSDTSSAVTKAYCPTPTGLSATRTSTTTATLNWTDTGADEYKIKHRSSGTSNWTWKTVAGPASSTNISGLTTGANHEWKIRAICNAGGNKPYSSTQTIATYIARMAASNANVEGFRTYPNPTNGSVNIEFNSIMAGDVIISILDLSGRVLYANQFETTAGFSQTNIDLTNLQNGAYIIELVENTGLNHRARVIKR